MKNSNERNKQKALTLVRKNKRKLKKATRNG